VRIEVLEQLEGSTVLEPWLRRGVRVYHEAYEVADLEAALRRLVEGGNVVVRPALPAVAFDGRRIAFVMLSNMGLVEVIERGRQSSGRHARATGHRGSPTTGAQDSLG
jgi:glyoxalase/bleomycin resistance protein/dioxygenase superfamily protein